MLLLLYTTAVFVAVIAIVVVVAVAGVVVVVVASVAVHSCGRCCRLSFSTLPLLLLITLDHQQSLLNFIKHSSKYSTQWHQLHPASVRTACSSCKHIQ